MDNFFPSSFSFNFYTIVLFSAIFISILVLVYIGWLMQKQSAGSTFPSSPPITKVSDCPDGWTMLDNKYCSIPNSSDTNIGLIYKKNSPDDFITSMITSFPNLLFNLTNPPVAITTVPESTVTMGILFPSDPCIKNKWAIKYNILWDGISNYVSPACTIGK